MDAEAAPAGEAHAHAEHPPFLAHHYETPAQQLHASKLGMWLFLATEILMFSGLFCAYWIYRTYYPQYFHDASLYLDRTLGAFNTIVLICSSLTIAWAVRAAALNQQRLLQAMLVITIACGGIFMGVKYIEYEHKWKDHLLPGTRFKPELGEGHGTAPAPVAPAKVDASPTQPPAANTALPPGLKAETYLGPTGSEGPQGLAEGAASHDRPTLKGNAQVFFSIYFLMTGLHGLHVLIGMGLMVWLLIRARRKEFSSAFYTPVDLVGLYWHVVDIVWIYLFPLLYLIH